MLITTCVLYKYSEQLDDRKRQSLEEISYVKKKTKQSQLSKFVPIETGDRPSLSSVLDEVMGDSDNIKQCPDELKLLIDQQLHYIQNKKHIWHPS